MTQPPPSAAEPGRVEQRLSLITLGVEDLEVSRAFYHSLGWQAGPSPDDVAFFQIGGMVLALWERQALAADSGIEHDGGGWGGVTLAHNVRSPQDVDDVLAAAQAAGARIVRGGAPTFWGGYSGVFHDPDGHAFEVAHNPGWEITPDGRTLLGDGSS